ncbi:hypothetical protein D1BOALGB6SA_8129 [Olavius sp. associated proteobacterium Delta 1]|nr:hypothetical protein D1BOALGB6SA_8129 [Olavius sp. associated proteobacterium Delta 1]
MSQEGFGMYVPSYQMHNVLNVYSKQLRQNMVSDGKNKRPETPPSDRINISPEGKRQIMIEKISKDIVDKISRYGSLNETRQQISEYTNIYSENKTLPNNTENKTFVFNAIDSINQKNKNTLSVDDSSFLIQRLEQLAKKASDKKTESWI